MAINSISYSDRDLLKKVFKDIASTMGLYAYLGDPRAMFALSVADKIRQHINGDEFTGWDKKVMDEILKEKSSPVANIINNEQKKIY